MTGTAVYGTVRTVWEDGGGNSASYPIAPGRAHPLGGPLRTRSHGDVTGKDREGLPMSIRKAAC